MYRTKEEKQSEVKKIITKLTELKLTIIYEPIQQLFKELKMYVDGQKSVKINIPFPEIRKNIEGVLPVEANSDCWVKLTNL